MGKTKDDVKLKRSSPSPRDEGKSKKRRSRGEDEDKSKKKHKSHGSSSRHSEKAKKSERKRKDKSRKHKSSSLQELSSDDYFSKNNEFAMWLKEEKKLFFSDLCSDSARSLFTEFVSDWNNQELESKYYEGITAGPRSSHKWNIKK